MTKISIITQNFSSPDVYSDTPLMLLPQPPPPLPDRDQEGFSQLLLHDLHRHRQTYVRSYTAFETLKKRQDFVLRQENLRSLQNFEQRITTKQEQFLDQSVHSYEQCFVKVINGNLNSNGNLSNQQRRIKSATPNFDKYHMHQLSHIPAMPLDPPAIIPFHRYKKSHRPPLPSKHRSYTNLNRSAQSFHDAFQSSSFSNHSQPFLSFTESYLQKYGDRSVNKYQFTVNNDDMDDIKERHEDENEDDEGDEQQQQRRSASVEPNIVINQNKNQRQKSKTPDLKNNRANVSSRNTNTPSSTPQMGYNDAVRDGLNISKDNTDHGNKTSLINEKRRSSQQSTSQLSNGDSKTSTKRPKSGKKKHVIINLTSDKKSDILTTKINDNDILKTAIFVQNYESNPTPSTVSSKIERPQLPTTTIRKPLSTLRRSSVKSNDGNSGVKQILDNIDTQITTRTIDDNSNKEQVLAPITNNITENKTNTNDQSIQQLATVDVADIRKRTRKGAFDASESMNDLVKFELGMMGSQRGAMKKNRFRSGKENQNEDGTDTIPENQETLDLLEKIRQSSTGLAVGQPPLSQQGCRFELPYDLKLLETLTPLEYLGKYCRLSSRRNYQFKRIFDKYRNNQYRFESSNLYQTIVDVHSESFTRSKYDYLCQLIDIGTEQHQFTFDTFAGILALCERILYESSQFRSGLDEHDLAKDTIEKCDFDSLERKLDGLVINETMKRLLKTL